MSKKIQKFTREEHLALAPTVVALKAGLLNISSIIIANKRRKSDWALTHRSYKKAKQSLFCLCEKLHHEWFDLDGHGFIYDYLLNHGDPFKFAAAVDSLLADRHRTMRPSEYARWLRENVSNQIEDRILGHVPAATLDLWLKLDRQLSALVSNLAYDEQQWSNVA